LLFLSYWYYYIYYSNPKTKPIDSKEKNLNIINCFNELSLKIQEEKLEFIIAGGIASAFYYKKIYRTIKDIDIIINFKDKELVFLTRGTDVYTEKQTIEYDLSRFFNLPSDALTVKGQYYLNLPSNGSNPSTATQTSWNIPGITPSVWRTNHMTPESHDIINNNNPFLYKKSFSNFIPTNWSAFTNNSVKYYTSTDKSRLNFKAFNDDQYSLGDFTFGVYCPVDYSYSQGYSTLGYGWAIGDPPEVIDANYLSTVNGGTYRNNIVFDQGVIEGTSFIGSNITPGNLIDIEDPVNFARIYAPAYHLENQQDVSIVNNQRLILRTDRLPISSVPKINGNNSLPLFLNDNFSILAVSDSGQVQEIALNINQQTDQTNNLQDLTGDTQTATSDAVINSLTCEGLTTLSCYSGYGGDFGVVKPCADNEDSSINTQRVVGGCYFYVQKPFIVSIPKDVKFFNEWKARFRLSFAACRGVIGHVFQNNWINGVLYSFSFNKKTIFDTIGNVKRYKYCGTKQSSISPIRPNQGPLFFDESRNSFFYRSTPYNGSPTTGRFKGQEPKQKTLFGLGSWERANFGGMNDRNIFFPTTIMDLGPRDQFAKEICFNPQLDGYLVETLKSTSYNETSDVLLFFILSRLLNTTFGQRILGTGDASVDTLFSRTEKRLDGDVTQLFSINSEYGILPFNDDNYDDNSVFLLDNNGPLIGIHFTANTENRIKLTPGIVTYGTVLQKNG
jgi:hypothetical protein